MLRFTRAALALSVAVSAAACAFEPSSKSGDVALVTAAQMGDPARGQAYAEVACASCHAVANGQVNSPNPDAPAFDTVANMPGMTSIALNVWLHTSHPTMPNLLVEPDRIDDLSAYLETLKSDD